MYIKSSAFLEIAKGSYSPLNLPLCMCNCTILSFCDSWSCITLHGWIKGKSGDANFDLPLKAGMQPGKIYL